MIGNDRDFNNHIVLNNATNNFKYAGTPLNVNNGRQKKYARYLTHVSGLYMRNLHLGHSWSEPVRAPVGYSIGEMPTGTGLTRHYWTASDIPKLPGWWPHPAGSHQKFYFPDHRPAPYENQPYYNASADSNNGAFASSFTASKTAMEQEFPAYNYTATAPSAPAGNANRQVARDFTAINIGYAGFNKAILGAYGLYTSNLVLGDRNSARNTRRIRYGCEYRQEAQGSRTVSNVHSCVGNWPAHDEGLISYFTEFRLRNVRMEVGSTGLNPNSTTTWSCANRTGLIQVRTANNQQTLNGAIANDEKRFRMKNAVKMLFSLRKITNDSIASSTAAEVEILSQNRSDETWNIVRGTERFYPYWTVGNQVNNTALYTQDIRRRYIRGLRGAQLLKDHGSTSTWHTLSSNFGNEAKSIFNAIEASNTAIQHLVNADNIAEILRNNIAGYVRNAGINSLQGELQNYNLQVLLGHHHALRYHYDTSTYDLTAMNTLNNMVSGISNASNSYLTHLNTLLVTNKKAQGMLNWISHHCNHEHEKRITRAPVPRPSSSLGPAPQTAWQNFSDVGFMNGLLRRSDARLKKNIRPLQVRAGALEQIRLRSFSHRADPSEREQLGFVAQEVNAHYPELVRTDEDGYLSMSYDGMVPVLWGHLADWKRTRKSRVQDIDARLKLLEQQAADGQ